MLAGNMPDIFLDTDVAFDIISRRGPHYTSSVVSGGKGSAMLALQSAFKDKEDALQYHTALRAKADYFVTRNKKDYKHKVTSLPVFTPVEFSELTR